MVLRTERYPFQTRCGRGEWSPTSPSLSQPSDSHVSNRICCAALEQCAGWTLLQVQDFHVIRCGFAMKTIAALAARRLRSCWLVLCWQSCQNRRDMEVWKTLRVSNIPTAPAATITDKCLTGRYTNTPVGRKDRFGHYTTSISGVQRVRLVAGLGPRTWCRR